MKNRKANRLKGYDYTRNHLYFETSLVRSRNCLFGEIKDHKMILNECGQIAENQWLWLASQYPYVHLHDFIIMPDHIHGILEINCDQVRVGRDLPLPNPDKQKIKSLSELIGAYKTGVSKRIHLLGKNEFKWRRSFHDHIIRDKRSFTNISNYIKNNPSAEFLAHSLSIIQHQ